MSLPYDVARCVGVSADDGYLVKPCSSCRRLLEAKPQGEWTPWIDPPRKGWNDCPQYLEKKE